MVTSRRAAQHVIALVLFELVAVGGLHLIGTRSYVQVDWLHISRWLASTPPDQVVMSLVWLVALVLAWWTLGTTVLYLLTRVRGFRAGARIAERLAPAAIRRVIDRAVTATAVTSVLLATAAPALAEERPPPPITQQAPAALQYEPQPAGTENPQTESPSPGPGAQRQAPQPVEQPPREQQPIAGPGEDAAVAEMEAEAGRGGEPAAKETPKPTEAESRVDATEAATSHPAADEAHADRDQDARADQDGDRARDNRGRRSKPRAGDRYTVRPGDHLWKIAEAVVAADGASSRKVVASYWAELVRVATPHLRSDDPNLIYPGEEIELPPLDDRMDDRR